MYQTNYIANWEECVRHILECYPNEGGGIVTTDNVFHPIENISETPLTAFEFPPSELIGVDVKCILHSHPYDPDNPPGDDPRIPSKADMQGQIDTDVEWAIVVTEGENVTPPVFWGDYDHRPDLFDREFIHNVQDCLAFVSDWYYKEYGIKMGLFARDFYWFEDGKNHLEEQYKAWGFEEVSPDEPQMKGDVLMYSIQSKVINHIGVVTEPNRVAHHLYSRFPKSEPYQIWHKYVTRRVRRKSLPK